MAALFNPNSDETLSQEQSDSFYELLESLTSPSKLSVSVKGTSSRLVTVLVALSQLTQFAPKVFDTKRGQKAIKFALEMVLLGRAHSSGDSDSDVEEEIVTPSPSKRRRKSSNQSRDAKHRSPGQTTSLVEDESLSTTCRTLCAAIEFLASYIRASIFSSKTSRYVSTQQMDASQTELSSELIEKVFEILSQVTRDHGVPPSDHDRKECKLRQDRAALRQCAAIHLLRLCDPRLGLDRKFLTTDRWHILAGAFLDDEQVVRDAVMSELSLMLTGHGKFGKCGEYGPMVPLLRLVAFVVLCVDGDHGAGHSIANGNAANVGKKASNIKAHTKECIIALRKAYEVTAAQARANGDNAERRFESTIKVALMPEYIVPYAMHLLAFRRETPHVGGKSGVTQTSQEDDDIVDEVGQRVLRKRLKQLFDPLVLSLGDSADNISFLLRMTELLGKYEPFRESKKSLSQISIGSRSDDEEDSTLNVSQREGAKLKVVCAAAREVLLSYVKKDVNLAVYPGKIVLRPDLFKKRTTLKSIQNTTRSKKRKSTEITQDAGPKIYPASDETDLQEDSLATRPVASQVSRESNENFRSPVSQKGPGDGHVHFSPEITIHNDAQDPSVASFGDLSPINKASPAGDAGSDVLLSSGEKTRGTTPPSVVRNTRFSTSASLAMDVTVDSEEASPVSKMSGSTNRSGKTRSTRNSASSAESKESSETETTAKKRRSSKNEPAAKRQKARPPAQIKVTRRKSKPSAATEKQTTKRTRRNSKKAKVQDDFDFEDSGEHEAPAKNARKGKENNVKAKIAPKRNVRRGLKSR